MILLSRCLCRNCLARSMTWIYPAAAVGWRLSSFGGRHHTCRGGRMEARLTRRPERAPGRSPRKRRGLRTAAPDRRRPQWRRAQSGRMAPMRSAIAARSTGSHAPPRRRPKRPKRSIAAGQGGRSGEACKRAAAVCPGWRMAAVRTAPCSGGERRRPALRLALSTTGPQVRGSGRSRAPRG